MLTSIANGRTGDPAHEPLTDGAGDGARCEAPCLGHCRVAVGHIHHSLDQGLFVRVPLLETKQAGHGHSEIRLSRYLRPIPGGMQGLPTALRSTCAIFQGSSSAQGFDSRSHPSWPRRAP